MRQAPFYLLLISLTLSSLTQAESELLTSQAAAPNSINEMEQLKTLLVANQQQLNQLHLSLEQERAENARQQQDVEQLHAQLQQARSTLHWLSSEQGWFALGAITVLFSFFLGRFSKAKRRKSVEWVN